MRTESPRVSVVVPLYNSSAYVTRALRSVLAQREADFEVIVVDDGSDDGGAEVVRSFTDARIRLISQTHAGVSVARNRGAAEARAPWICFLDADDEWLPEFLERALRATAVLPDTSAVVANYQDSATSRPFLASGVADDARPIDDYFQFQLQNDCRGALLSATLVRRSKLTDCGGFEVGVARGEDQDLLCRLAAKGAFCYLARPLVVYHTDVPGSAMDRQRRDGPDFPAVVDTLAAWQRSGTIREPLLASSRRFASRLLMLHAIELLNRGRRTEASRLLAERPELAELRLGERLRVATRRAVPPALLARLVAAHRALAGQPLFESSSWVLSGYAAGQAIRLLSHLVLARLLAPEIFGVVAIAGVVLQGLEMLTDVGAGPWLIRDERGSRQEAIDTAFLAQAARGALVALSCLGLAGAIAALYSVPELASLIPAAAVASLLVGLSSTSLHTALRHGNVKAPTLVELGAQCAAAATMLAWASLSPTPWALVAGNVAWAGARLILSYGISGEPRPRLRWDAESGRSLLAFSRWIWVSSALYFAARQADRALLGAFLELRLLGAYVLGATIVDTLTALNQRLARHVLLPALSRTRREHAGQLAARFYELRRPLDAAFLSAALFLTFFARPIVELLYGQRYRDVAWMLAILGLLAGMRCLSEPCEQLLVALGATRTIAAAQAVRAVALLACVPIGWAAGAEHGAVWAVALSELPVLALLWSALRSRGSWRAAHELPAAAVLLFAAVALSLGFA